MKFNDYIKYLCCDCKHDTASFCGDCFENEKCPFRKDDGACWESPLSAPAAAEISQDAAAPIAVKHDYRNIKVAEDTHITIDLEDMKRQLERDLYKDMLPELHYGA
jgi:hypothetical protein